MPRRRASRIAFLIFDIDHFKRVNDTYGHDIGDEVLREFAGRIAANVRGIDLACRYGGEEFVVVMPDTDVDFAYSVAERLRKSVETTPFDISRAPHHLNITISIGIAGSKVPGDTAAALLHRADQALYRAKTRRPQPRRRGRGGLRSLGPRTSSPHSCLNRSCWLRKRCGLEVRGPSEAYSRSITQRVTAWW